MAQVTDGFIGHVNSPTANVPRMGLKCDTLPRIYNVCPYYALVPTHWAYEGRGTNAKGSAHVGLPVFVPVFSPLPDDMHCSDVSIRDIDRAGMGKLSAATLRFQERQLTFTKLSNSWVLKHARACAHTHFCVLQNAFPFQSNPFHLLLNVKVSLCTPEQWTYSSTHS